MNPLIEQFRQLRPDYKGVGDEDIAKLIGVPYERESDFARGLGNYLPQTNEMFGVGQTLAGEGLRRGLGENQVSSYLLKAGQERMQQAQKEQVSMPEDNFDNAWKKGLGTVVTDWLPYQIGQGVGNAAETLTSMGLGSALGATLGSSGAPGVGTAGGAAAGAGAGLFAKTMLKQAALEEAKKIMATRGEAAASKFLSRELGSAVGGNAGMLADSLFHGVGETGQRAIEEAKGVEGVDFDRLVPAALGHAGLEFVGDKVLTGAMRGMEHPPMSFQKNGMKALPANIGAGMLDIGLKEAPVEMGQTAMERYGANLPLDSEDAKTDYLNSAAAAFGMGVLPGAVGGTRSAFARDPNYKTPTGDIPASASAGEALGSAASRGADMVKGLYDKLMLPEASSPDMLVLNQPIDQANPIVAATQRNNAALRMATGLWDNPSAGADEKEAAAKFLAARKQATTDAEQDAAALAFRDDINGVFSSKTIKSDFAQAKQDFLRGTQRRGNEQNEAGLYGFEHRPDQPLPAGQLLLQLRGGKPIRHFYGEEVRPDREAVKATAQAWLRDHVNPAFPKLDIHDPEVRNGAEALFDWVAQRMPNFDKVSHAVVRMWGPDAGELVRQAHRYGVAEGIIPKNPLIAERVEKAAQVLTNVAKGGSGRVEQMAQLVRPLVATKITTSLLREVDTTLRAFANGDANINPKLLNDTLDHVFGHNKDEVFKLYEPAHNEQLDFDNAQATDSENVDDEYVGTNDWNGNIQTTQGETTYHGNGSVAFDTSYPAAKLSMQKALEESPGRHTIGAWTRLKREYTDNREALTAQEDELIQKYHGLDAEGLKAQAHHHGVSVDTERTSILKAINRRAQWVADEHQSPEGVDLSARDVKNMRDTKGDIQHGRILLEQLVDDKSKPKVDEATGEMTFEKKADPVFFSIGNIIRVMRAKRNAGALDERGGSSKELGPAQTYRLLLAGLSSLLDTGKYTHRLGYPDKSGQVTWLQESGRLPDALYDPFTGLSIKQMREAVASERRDEGREPRTGEVGYAETHAQKLASLRDFVDSLSNRVSQMTEEGQDASKLMKYRDYLSDQVKHGARKETKIDQLYREQRQWVPGNDAPRKTASETRVITEVHGFKEVQNKATGETEEVADVRTHVFRDDPTESDEMAAQGGENTGVENRDFEHSLDRDETGQSIPERPNNAQPSPQQLAYLSKLLRKGVPAVMEFVKDMNKARFTSVLQTLRQMLRDKSALGELRNVAQNAVARMEAMASEKRAKSRGSHALSEGTAEFVRQLFSNGFVAKVRSLLTSTGGEPTITRDIVSKLRGKTKYDFASYSDSTGHEVRSVLNGVKVFLGEHGFDTSNLHIALYLNDLGGKSFMNFVPELKVIGLSYSAVEEIHSASQGGKLAEWSKFDLLRAVLHEAAHAIDFANKASFSAKNPKWAQGGIYFKEASELVNRNEGAVLHYPLDDLRSGAFTHEQAVPELFAQTHALFTLAPKLVSNHSPALYSYFSEIANARTDEGLGKVITGNRTTNELGATSQKSAVLAGQSAPVGERSGRADDSGRSEDDSVKSNAQNPVSKEVTEEEKQQVKDELLQMLGPQVEVLFQKFVKGPKGQRLSGEWMNNLIKIAIKAGDAAGVGRHEAFHQFFQWLQDAKVGNVEELFKAVTDNKLIHNQLRRLLADHPNALKQLSDPVEAAAYLFQFWKAGLIRLGPKNETFMQRAVTFLRELTGLITQETRDLRHAETIMQAFSDGHFAGGKDVVNAVLDKHLGEQRDAWANTFWRKLAKNDVLRKAVYTAGDVLRDTKNPALVSMADMLYTPEGGKVGGRQAYFDALPAERARRLNVLNNIMLNSDPEDFPAITKHLQEETPSTMIHDPVVRDKVEAIRGFLEDMHKYMVEKNVQRLDTDTKTWVPIGKVNHYYFPRVWDASKLAAAPEEFVKLLMEHHADQLGLIAKEHDITAQEVAEGITRRLIDNSVPDITESSSELGITPYMKSINKRSLNWIDPKVFSDFMSKDLTHILTNYTVQAVKRAEFTDRFGNEGEVLQNSIDDAFLHEAFDGNASKVKAAKSELSKRLAAWNDLPEDQQSRTPEPNLHDVVSNMVDQSKYEQAVESMKLPVQAVMAAEGTLGRDIDPRLQKAFGYVTAYQNLRLLALALFSSFGDPLGIVVRGGTMKEAYEAFSYGVKEVVLGWKGQLSADEKAKLAERIGTVDAGNFLDALGQTYSSLYMYENLRKTNDALFKWNGMEAWNRAMRIQATQAAIGFIEKHLSDPNEHSERYLKDELGLRDKDATYLKDGKLDTDNAQVREAIVRWVNGAILRPNAMQRPIVASDPHYQLFYHLKQFTYSFHKTILQRVAVEYQHGNLTPAMALIATYVPMMVAADVLKELLVPGDDPAWMKAGLGGIVRHGVERANLFGVPQMFADGVGSPLEPTGALHKAAGLFGPSASEVVDWALLPFNSKDSFGKEVARSVPLSQIVSRASTLAD